MDLAKYRDNRNNSAVIVRTHNEILEFITDYVVDYVKGMIVDAEINEAYDICFNSKDNDLKDQLLDILEMPETSFPEKIDKYITHFKDKLKKCFNLEVESLAVDTYQTRIEEGPE